MIVSTLSIGATDQNGQNISYAGTPTGFPTNNVPGYLGWSGTTYNYVASVTVSNPNHYGFSGDTTPVTVNRFFQVTTVPLFQAAIFYENVLEIHPGAFMKITGLVHSNDSIYALGFLANLQFMSTVSYVGTYQESSNPVVRYGWDGSNNAGDLIPDPWAAYYPDYWADGQPSSSSTSRATQLNRVSTIDPFGTTSSSNNGLYPIVQIPAVGNTSDQIAYNNASLRIIINSAIPVGNPLRYTITDGSGVPGNLLTGADYNNVVAALTATPATTIFDQREGATVTVTSLDMAKLAYATVPAPTLTATGEFGTVAAPSGSNSDGTSYANGTTFQKNFAGTVYIHDIAPTGSSTRTAIRLVNGRKLGQNITIASDNGMYIQGDYNTGGSSPSDVPTDGSGTSPQATTYSRHSSSIMADAATILSNGWVDGNSSAALNSRNATATTVNTAILAGDVPSNANGDGIASGGAHNFPRFLENWNGINFTYYGSLVEAFHSTKFTGSWQTNNVYYWPNRLWNFDTVFLQKQPPGVPTGILFSRGRYDRAVN